MFTDYYGNIRWGRIVAAVLGLAVVCAIVVPIFRSYTAIHEGDVTVVSCGMVTDSQGGHTYRVATDKGTFRMTDTLIGGTRLNTADAYYALVKGATYHAKWYGVRFGLTSSMPNLTSMDPVEPNPKGEHCS